MSDTKDMFKRIIIAVKSGNYDAIDKAIREIYLDGFHDGEECARWDQAEEDEMLPPDTPTRH